MITQSNFHDTSLKRLKRGEHGVIAGIQGATPAIAAQLRHLGLLPGVPITLEQRSPRLVVRTRKGTVALTQGMFQSIQVRMRANLK